MNSALPDQSIKEQDIKHNQSWPNHTLAHPYLPNTSITHSVLAITLLPCHTPSEMRRRLYKL